MYWSDGGVGCDSLSLLELMFCLVVRGYCYQC